MNSPEDIAAILAADVYAVIGVSKNPQKYGYLVWRTIKNAGKTAYAVNPNATSIEGEPCYPSLAAIPAKVDAVVTVVQPAVTEQVVQDCKRLGLRLLWMQIGSESEASIADAEKAGINLVAGGPCIMVMLRTYRFNK